METKKYFEQLLIERLLKTITDASLEYLDFETSRQIMLDGKAWGWLASIR